MTKDQFNTALACCIAIEADPMGGGFPCWPMVGIGGNADSFTAYDTDREILLAGVYADTAITGEDVTLALANAFALGGFAVPCIIANAHTTPAVLPDDVLLYFAGLNNDGLLVFTDFSKLEWWSK